ncbi:MAG TPA: hypothetical protein VF530_04610 [Planctomycetota bacterium]
MAVRVALVALILVAAILGFFLVRGERTAGRAAPRTGAPEERIGPADLAPAALEPAPAVIESALQREAVPAIAAEGAAAPALAPTSGRRLRGVLRHSADHRPVPDAQLVFWQGETFSEALTGADGSFTTDPVLASGAVRVWHKGPAPDPTLLHHLEIRPETLLLPEPPPGADFEPVELLLVDPPAWVEVEVVHANGVPAEAQLRWLFRPPAGGGTMMRAPTGADGRARVAFPRIDPGAYLLLVACTAEEVSEIVRVDAPPDGERVRLVLEEGGRVRVHVLEADGRPRPGQQVAVEDPEALHRLLDLGSQTGADGVALVSGVPPGPRRAQFHDEETSETVRAMVTVERGLTVDVELRVPDLPIAAAGRVLDAEGRPRSYVTVVATIAGRSDSVQTDTEGAFSIGWKRERGPVRLTIDAGLTEDRYLPAALEVPFGTRDVLFRCAETRPTVTLALEVVEEKSGALLPGAMVLGFLEPARSSWSFHRATEGLATLQLKPYDDVGLAIEAVGYRRRIVSATELLRDAPAGTPARVALAPGLERWLQVLDEEDDAPLLDARVLDGERLVATTDADGRAWIDLAQWPAELRVEAAGHAQGRWTCRDWLTELGDGVLWLARASAEIEPR